MKVELKDLSETRKQLVVALDAAEIDAENRRITSEFMRQARIPGFRPGHAPAAVVQKRFQNEIAEELKQAVTARAYRDGIKEAKLDVITVTDVGEAQIAPGQPAEIAITVDVRPNFELPKYEGLPVKAGDTTVADAEIDQVIENLRRERAEFRPVERAAEPGDYVKFGFEGTLDGQKIAELAPDNPIYGNMPHTWEEAGSEEGLLPGAGKQLVGTRAGDRKDVEITFPAEFGVAVLAGKTAHYALAVQEVRERVLPELDETFLKAQGVASVEELREQVRRSLVARKEAHDRSERRRQIADALAAQVEFPIPETLIDDSTEGLLRQLVEQNIRRGVPQEELEKNKDEIYASARKAAIERTKLRLILARIAETEKLTVESADLERFVTEEAIRSNQRPEKLVKELQKDRSRLQAIQQNILLDKALDFLVEKATVTPA